MLYSETTVQDTQILTTQKAPIRPKNQEEQESLEASFTAFFADFQIKPKTEPAPAEAASSRRTGKEESEGNTHQTQQSLPPLSSGEEIAPRDEVMKPKPIRSADPNIYGPTKTQEPESQTDVRENAQKPQQSSAQHLSNAGATEGFQHKGRKTLTPQQTQPLAVKTMGNATQQKKLTPPAAQSTHANQPLTKNQAMMQEKSNHSSFKPTEPFSPIEESMVDIAMPSIKHTNQTTLETNQHLSLASPRFMAHQITATLSMHKGHIGAAPITITLRLKPKELGTINITVHTAKDVLKIHMQGLPNAIALLKQTQHMLAQDLQHQGWQIGQEDFSFNNDSAKKEHASSHQSTFDKEKQATSRPKKRSTFLGFRFKRRPGLFA